jgi:hypothetical protein
MRPLLLRAAVALVVVNAAAGIVVIAGGSGDFDETEGRVLLTTLCLSAAAFLLVPSFVALEGRRLNGLALVAGAGVIVGWGAVTYGVWAKEFEGEPDFWNTAWSLVIAGMASAHVTLVSLARTAGRRTWLQGLAVALTAVFAAELIAAIWGDFEDENGARVIAITAILVVASSVLIPIVQHGARSPGRVTRVAYCPACGGRLLSATADKCSRCGARFHVDLIGPGNA